MTLDITTFFAHLMKQTHGSFARLMKQTHGAVMQHDMGAVMQHDMNVNIAQQSVIIFGIKKMKRE